MSIEIKTFIRKPLQVEGTQVTTENFEAVAAWCQGTIVSDNVDPGRTFIRVRTTNPHNPRQSQARVGDWVLSSDMGFKVYTDKAFTRSFDVATHAREIPTSGPQNTGSVSVQNTTALEMEGGYALVESTPAETLAKEARVTMAIETPEDLAAAKGAVQATAKDGLITSAEADAVIASLPIPEVHPVGTQPMPPQPLPGDVEEPARPPAVPENLKDRDPNVVYPPETNDTPAEASTYSHPVDGDRIMTNEELGRDS